MHKNKILILMDMPLFPYRIYAYNELVDRGYDLTIITASNKEVDYSIPLKFNHRRLCVVNVGPFYRLKDFFRLDYNAFDYIIVTPNLRCLSFYKFLFGHKYDQKLLAWGHLKGCTTGNKIADRLRTRICKKMQSLIFYECGTKDEFISKGFSSQNLFVANNTQYVNHNTVKLGLEKKYFLYVGRIQDRKALDIATRAFASFKRKNPSSKLTFRIVGDGKIGELEEIVIQEKIHSSVEFIGAVHDEELLGDIFSHAIAYVSPGHVGLGVLHSMAFGVPVITCSGRVHSVEFSNCKPDNSIVVPFTVDDVRDAMECLAINIELRNRLSENAYYYYWNNCTINKMVDGIDDAIKYLSSKSKK